MEAAEPAPGPFCEELVSIAERAGLPLAVGLPVAHGDSVTNRVGTRYADGCRGRLSETAPLGGPARPPLGRRRPERRGVAVRSSRAARMLRPQLPRTRPGLRPAGGRRPRDRFPLADAVPPRLGAPLSGSGVGASCYVVASKHVGDQLGQVHAGHSHVAGPRGPMLDETGEQPGGSGGGVLSGGTRGGPPTQPGPPAPPSCRMARVRDGEARPGLR